MAQSLKKLDRFLLLYFAKVLMFLFLLSILLTGIMVFVGLPVLFFVDIAKQEWISAGKDVLFWLFAFYWTRAWGKIAPHIMENENIIN